MAVEDVGGSMVKTRLPHRCRSPECQGGTVFTRRLEELLGRHSLLWEAVRPLLEVREEARREIAGLYRKLLGLARTDVDGRRSMTVPGIGRIERRRLVGIQQRLGVLAAACVDGDAAPRPPAARRFCRPETEAGRGKSARVCLVPRKWPPGSISAKGLEQPHEQFPRKPRQGAVDGSTGLAPQG